MNNSGDNNPGPAAENGRAIPPGWHIPQPEFIPPPTYWPFVLSLGATLMGLGVLTSHVITAAGTALFLLGTIKWIGELASEH
jgi:hypothetical protein